MSAANKNSEKSYQRRFAFMCTELLPPVPAGGTAATNDRYGNESFRIQMYNQTCCYKVINHQLNNLIMAGTKCKKCSLEILVDRGNFIMIVNCEVYKNLN